ncbi:uncharacterized protein LOC108605936 [Drosophila busckii]|nr:uncharacterized protein LOC108605936 [Drosophila busckii]
MRLTCNLLALLLASCCWCCCCCFGQVIPTAAPTPPPPAKAQLYHFITEHRPTTMGQNHYIKPGQVLGTFNLDSGSLHVRQEDSKRPISSKLNIIFVPAPMDNIDIRK